MDNIESLKYFLPEGFISGVILAVLVYSLFARRRPDAVFFLLAGTAGATVTLVLEIISPLAGEGAALFHGMLRDDRLSQLFKIICILSSAFLLFLSWISGETMKRLRHPAEYVMLVLTNTLGMMLLASSYNLLSMYLSVEFISLTSYLLTGFADRDERSSEAAIKYILYGGVVTGVMVYGLSLLYGITGTLGYDEIRLFIARSEDPGLMLYISIIMILAGMGFKIAAAPFHSWCPDVYEGAATPVAAFLSVGPKAAGFALMLGFFSGIFILSRTPAPAGPDAGWSMMLAIMSALTMTIGNIAALSQKNIKRLLAYSSIAHAGYVLMAVASGPPFGIKAAFFYTAVYLLMNLGAFLVVIEMSNELNSESVDDYEALAWKGPKGAFLAAALAVFLFSLTGVPPFAGFIGKLYLLLSIFEKGSTLYWLAAVAVANTVISFAYYARVLKVMFLSSRHKGLAFVEMNRAQYVSYAAIAGIAVFTIFFGLYWTPLERLGRLAAGIE